MVFVAKQESLMQEGYFAKEITPKVDGILFWHIGRRYLS